jgi:Glutathione synthase/Ribosomal protein S6 modification enzyme (glutaminyl transferase)
VNNINHLIISSSADYSTDLICCEFEKRGSSYFRLNRDQFSEFDILYRLSDNNLHVTVDNEDYVIDSKDLISVYFRAPVFLRSSNKTYSLEEQLYKSQWSSFIRNLCVFESANWVNHPVNTYKAENKVLQLKIAKNSGFIIPKTFVGNTLPSELNEEELYIVKSIDTALFYDNGQEMFTYSTKTTGEELLGSELKAAPVIIQECLSNKIDIRVTIIGDKIFPVSVTNNGLSIDGDWRRTPKELLKYTPIKLPETVVESIQKTMKSLGLKFGGMDLAVVDDKYYFIEVNPTGEWGWLVSSANYQSTGQS